MFLLKPAQAEKNECLTAALAIYNELQMTWKRPIKNLSNVQYIEKNYKESPMRGREKKKRNENIETTAKRRRPLRVGSRGSVKKIYISSGGFMTVICRQQTSRRATIQYS